MAVRRRPALPAEARARPGPETMSGQTESSLTRHSISWFVAAWWLVAVSGQLLYTAEATLLCNVPFRRSGVSSAPFIFYRGQTSPAFASQCASADEIVKIVGPKAAPLRYQRDVTPIADAAAISISEHLVVQSKPAESECLVNGSHRTAADAGYFFHRPDTNDPAWGSFMGSYNAPLFLDEDQKSSPEVSNATLHLSFGHMCSGLGWHRHGEAFSEQITGRKHWFLLPPLVDPNAASKAQPPQQWAADVEKLNPAHLLQCTVKPGETIWIPGGWWHATLNLDVFSASVSKIRLETPDVANADQASITASLSRIEPFDFDLLPPAVFPGFWDRPRQVHAYRILVVASSDGVADVALTVATQLKARGVEFSVFLVEQSVHAIEAVQSRGLVLGISETELKCVVGNLTVVNSQTFKPMLFDYIFLDNLPFHHAIVEGGANVGQMLRAGGYLGATLLPCDTKITRGRETASMMLKLLPDTANFVSDPYLRLGNNGSDFHQRTVENMPGEIRDLLGSLNHAVEDLWFQRDKSASSKPAFNSVGSLLIQLRGLQCTSLANLRKKAALSKLRVVSLDVNGKHNSIEQMLCSNGGACDQGVDNWELMSLLGLTPGWSVPVYLQSLTDGDHP